MIATERLAALPEELGIAGARLRGPWKGRDLAGLEFQHPFLDLRVPAVLADYVTLDQGTGIVHTAPGLTSKDSPNTGVKRFSKRIPSLSRCCANAACFSPKGN